MSAMNTRTWPSLHRREALKLGAALIAGGLIGGREAQAAGEALAFDAESMQDTLRALGGIAAVGGEIELSIPDLVENGAFVPVTVECRLPGASEIFIVVEGNPNPLAARFTIPAGTEPFVATRIKMAETSKVYALVRAGGELYATFKTTEVTVGGCG